MDDLVTLTGIPARTIRSYIQRGLLQRPRFAAGATTYDRVTLGLLGAIRRGRSEHQMLHVTIKAKLRTLTPEQIEAWAEEFDPLREPDEDEETPPLEAPLPPSPAPAASPMIAERWCRVPLVPGLDLMMREGSSALVARLAREIQEKYGALGTS
jgi:DNA-binding transcriptional MerR regulator